MVKIKLGALITDVSGSIAGMTFQKSASGIVMKKKPNMGHRINNYSLQALSSLNYSNMARKSAFAEFLNLWSTMDEAIRYRWNLFASSYPYYGKNLNSRAYSGRDYFIAVHVRMRMHLASSYNFISAPYFESHPPVFSDFYYYIDAGKLRVSSNIYNPSALWKGFFFASQPKNTYFSAKQSNFHAVFINSGVGFTANLQYLIDNLGINYPSGGQYQKLGYKFHNSFSGQIATEYSEVIQYNL